MTQIPITVPSDTPLQAIIGAMSGIGLRVASGCFGTTLQFDRAQTHACEHPGCHRTVLVTDGVVHYCADHWMALKLP